jgi:hypothetical protein
MEWRNTRSVVSGRRNEHVGWDRCKLAYASGRDCHRGAAGVWVYLSDGAFTRKYGPDPKSESSSPH